jgi:hypothetical protein
MHSEMTATSAYAAIAAELRAEGMKAAVARLSSDERSALSSFWLGRADGELTTALSFEFMLQDLKALGAPVELTGLAERSIAEEHHHADWCLRMAALWSEAPLRPARLAGTRPLELHGASAHDNQVLRTVFGCCFSETVAMHVLLASQAVLTLDAIRRLNQQHLAEEVSHARLGWGLLGWQGLPQRDREMVSESVPALSELTRRVWYGPAHAENATLQELGYLSQPLVERACEAAFVEVIYPGLERCGVRVT